MRVESTYIIHKVGAHGESLSYGWLGRGSTKLILFAEELVHTKDGKDAEDEGEEGKHIDETWNGGQQGLDQFSHRGEGPDRAQWSENAEDTKGFQAFGIDAGEHSYDADTDYEEVEIVPRVLQVGPSAYNEAHGDHFGDALKDEDPSEDCVDFFLGRLPSGDVVWVEALLEIC